MSTTYLGCLLSVIGGTRVAGDKPNQKPPCPCVLLAQSCPALCDPMDCSPPGSSVPGILQARIPEWVAISFSSVLISSVQFSHSVVSDPLQLHGLYSPWNSPGQNIGVGSLSLLQRIFPTQGLNPGLPHRRQIFYQLSYKG